MNHLKSGLTPAVEHWTRLLLERGWCVVPNAVSPQLIDALDTELAGDFQETPFCSGGFYGSRTKRFGRLLARSPLAASIVQHPLILAIADQVLGPWCDTIQLNLTQALALHPGAPPQIPHRDQDMWRGAIGDTEYLLNIMWPFTRYTPANGATIMWPDSHGRRALDPEPPTGEFPVELEPGSALLFLGSTLHGAGGNSSDEVRRGAIVSYCLGWLKPYENQWLAYPPEVARTFSPELAALVGYRQHRPNLGNYEGQCPSVLLQQEIPERFAATDSLRPDQEELVAEFVRNQDWPERAAVA
ncbi:MAG TPA: phytanoyl-CoA dioxygenase family protein [Sphingomicrobium sp.]|nr:phytanoyl-CoA dioxygenase family protein [Sphingomicrobium sp.]